MTNKQYIFLCACACAFVKNCNYSFNSVINTFTAMTTNYPGSAGAKIFMTTQNSWNILAILR